jgi:hypothetical protein
LRWVNFSQVVETCEKFRLENLGAWRRFSQGDAGPGFSDKDLARVFCNS